MKKKYNTKLLIIVGICLLTIKAWGQSPLNPGFEVLNNFATDWKNTPSGSPVSGSLGARSNVTARTGSYSYLTATTTSSGGSTSHQNVSNLTIPASNWVHVIGWAKGFNTFSKAAMGGTLTPGIGGNTTTAAVNSTSFNRLVYNVQNGASEAVFQCGIYFKSTDGTATQVYFDDVIVYTDNTATEDITSPTTSSSFSTGTIAPNSIGFSWNNGTDAETGIQNTIILRTTNLSAITPVMNNQGVYSTGGGTAGPSLVSTDWTVISTSVSSGTTSYTDNTVSSGTAYKYAVIHRDMAYNYSTALVSGTIISLASEPTTQASAITFSTISPTGMTIGWTNGNGTNRIVIVKSGSTVDGLPIDGTTYTANPAFSTGTQIGTGNYVVYNSTSNSVAVTGLTAATVYYVAIYEFNGTGGTYNYLTSSSVTSSKTTYATVPSAPTTLSFSSITSNSQKVSFTAPLTAPAGYLVLRRTGSGVSGTPAVGTTYTQGDSNIGSGTNQVVYVGPSPWGNYDQTGFNDNTVYYYSVYSYTGSGASTNYSSALSGYRQTSLFSPAPSASSASTILSNGFTAIWSAVSGATSYKLDVNTSSAFPFNEDFQNFSLGTTSGSDGTNIASTLDSYTHVTGWSGSNLFQAGGSIRMATSTTVGYLVTPTIDLSGNGGNATLTFDVMGYTPDVNSVYQVLLSTDGGTNYTQIGSNLTVSSNSIFSSQSISISGGTVTSKIKILTVNATSGRIVIDNIKITQIDNISGYDNLSVASTSQAVTGLSPNTVYYYRVRATGVNSTSANSTIVSTTTLPAPPISTTATSITASGFTANWTAPTQGVEAFSYSVDYGTVSNLSSGVTTVSGIASSNLSNAITGLLPNTIYYYRVKAVNATGAGDYSAILSVITLPAAPTSSAATSITASGFTANWAAPTQGAATFTYSVDYGTVSDLSSGATTVSGITSSNLSNAITGLVPNTTYYYRVKAVNATGSGAVSDIQSVTTDVITQVSTPKNISDLTVTAGSVIDVTATGTLIFDQPTEVYTIAVEPGGKVTNSSTLNATNLTLNSNATGTATYLDNGTSNITTANVKQYLTMGRNWYVSVPITSTSRTAIDAGSVVCYKESTASWVTQTVDSTLNPMRGYIAVNPTTDGTVTFSGTLNNGSKSIVLTRTQGANKEGFNLVGNPYPSFIDWELATKSNLDATMWYRTKSATAYVFDTYNSQGHVGTGNNGINVTRYIPPMQAFWVRVLASGDGSSTTGMLSLNNTMRLHSEVSNKLKAPTSAKTIQQVLRLQVSNAVNSDETVLFFNSNAENTYDIYDSPKMSNGNNSIPEIFTLAENEHLVINGMNVVPYNTEIQLGFTTGESNTFSIKASEISNFDSNTQIYIRDNLTNTQWNLTNGSTYNFASDITASDTGRFSLIFKSNSIATVVENKSDKSNAILVYRNTNNQITVKCINRPENESYISLYNAVGLKLDEKKMENAVTTFEKIYSAGVYFISLKKNDNKICTKLILR